MKVAVLGGGLAGLSSAYELSKRGVDITVFEACPEAGGLAKSFSKDGFTYDLGPHRFHSNKKEIIGHLKEVMGNNLVTRNRISHIYLGGRLFKYPLEIKNVLSSMPISTTFKIGADYVAAQVGRVIKGKKDKKDASFEEWVVSRFGRTLYNIYFKPYTEKSWGLPCTKISPDWASQRITLLNLWDTAIKTIFKPTDVPRTYVSTFYYPEKGGIGQISKNYERYIISKGNKVLTNIKIKSVNRETNQIRSITYEHDGKAITENFDYVLSTIPLSNFAKLFEPKPEKDVLDAASQLKFRSIIFVYLILNKRKLSDNHWIYLPEKNFVSNRVSEFKNFSRYTAKKDKTIVCGEISCDYNDRLWKMSDKKLAEEFVKDIKKLKLAKDGDVLDSFVYRIEHAYPLYTLDYCSVLEKVFGFYDNIINLAYYGRNAMFRYNNMDQSVEMGIKVAQSLFDKNFKYKDIATEKEWFG